MPYLALLLAPFFNALIRAVLGTAAATTTYFWLKEHLQPHFDALISSINTNASDFNSVGGLAGDFYNFLDVSGMIVTITSAFSAVLAIKLYVFAVKAFSANPSEA